MEEVNLLLNGIYLNKGDFNTTIFLYDVEDLILIHLVEYQKDKFKRRIEFKKYKDKSFKYVTFSIVIMSNFVFSGNIVLSKTNEIENCNIEFQVLTPNSTSIIETYILEIIENEYKLTHIKTHNIIINTILQGSTSKLTSQNIYVFLFDIINKINNLRSIQNQIPFPIDMNINHILNEEKIILKMLQEIIEKHPEIKDFLLEYQNLERPQQLTKTKNRDN